MAAGREGEEEEGQGEGQGEEGDAEADARRQEEGEGQDAAGQVRGAPRAQGGGQRDDTYMTSAEGRGREYPNNR